MRSDTAKAVRALAANRMAIEAIDPEIDGGRFAAKTVEGAPFTVTADLFGDGHEVFGAAVRWRETGSKDWHEVPMRHLVNDRWTATFHFDRIGPHAFTIVAWRDVFATWRRDTRKKIAAAQNVDVEIEEARLLLRAIRARGEDAQRLKDLRSAVKTAEDPAALLTSDETAALMARLGPRANLTPLGRDLPVWVDRERAAFSLSLIHI